MAEGRVTVTKTSSGIIDGVETLEASTLIADTLSADTLSANTLSADTLSANTIVGARMAAGTTAPIITGGGGFADVLLSVDDAGGVFTVSQDAAPYSIQLPVATGPGMRYKFVMETRSAGTVINIQTIDLSLFNGVLHDGSTLTRVSGAGTIVFDGTLADLGDYIEVESASSIVPYWHVVAAGVTTGGVFAV
jgi:hypothetical protein